MEEVKVAIVGFGTIGTGVARLLIERGERFYGYYPMASHLKVRPGRVGRSGFTDVAGHRRELPDVYNRYTRASTDPAYRKELEAVTDALLELYRGLFGRPPRRP